MRGSVAEPVAQCADFCPGPGRGYSERVGHLAGGRALGVQREIGEDLDEVRSALQNDRLGLAVRFGTHRAEKDQPRTLDLGVEPVGDVLVERRIGFLDRATDLLWHDRGQSLDVLDGGRGSLDVLLGRLGQE